MNIHMPPTLEGLKTALHAPEDQQMPLFLQKVMEPIRPIWETSLRFMGTPGPQEDPALTAAQRFLFYTPQQGASQGLKALKRIEEYGSAAENLRLLQQAIDTLQPAEHGISLQDVHFAFVVGDPDRMTPPYCTGVGNVPGWILLMAFPTEENLPKLPAITMHEFHHQVRFAFEPFFPEMTLGKYIVAEGLAENFAAALCGEDHLGPWALSLQGEALEQVKPRFAQALTLNDFNQVRGYIFGDWAADSWGTTRMGIPDFAGYAMGYRLVQAYLKCTGKTIVEATYTPWQDIIRESGFFENAAL